ncbi:gliding motility lipoprotein GldB [Mucilaginibacter sp. RS28]|uniref:Gliding motility lipoprotein GldB n=2 Tax=Mucilaginibacter straminoryzae TaxID=2932774 RepID=A0A9X1X4Q3_9SPHI|nr:gliding motility lipoprotein GldB [Mucilaginibacter straminoryzae]MCJ8210380.1 gliding motility lipoprotein GldB [Mucilaginibacter straminoryzae]
MTPTLSKSTQIYLIFIGLIILTACNRKGKVDVSNIPVTVTVERFDHDFDRMRTGNMPVLAIELQKKYGVFYQDFIERILPAGSTRDTAYFATLRKVFGNKAYLDLKHEVDSVYPNLDKQNEELTDAFRRIEYYFHKKQLPKVYAYFSGFQTQTAIGNGYVGIGLDLFLGAKSKFYPALIESFPRYISHHFTPQNITPRVVEAMLREDMYPERDADKSLLQKMIYNGKIMYAMDLLLPDVPDSVKIRYTEPQMKWCKTFKSQIWGYFLEENLLYETDYQKIQQYLTDAPFTPGLGEKNESAPKLGVWTGWQIVRQYMEKHPDVTLPQLLGMTDAQKILNDSKYHPKQGEE